MTASNKSPSTGRSAAAVPAPLVSGRDVKDFAFVPPMVDLRGWDVLLSDGSLLGKVDRVLLDTSYKKPRYLAVTPNGHRGHLLVPIGVGMLERDRKQVVLHGFRAETVRSLPLITSTTVTREDERAVFGAITGRKPSEMAEPQWYSDPLFDPARLFGAPAPNTKS